MFEPLECFTASKRLFARKFGFQFSAFIVTSLRGLQQASELKNVQKKLGCVRASLGSLSEAASVFDPECLKEIVGELAGQLEPLAQDKRLNDIDLAITLVDGSLIAALPRIMEASFRKATTGSGMVKW